MKAEKQYINYGNHWIKIYPDNCHAEILNSEYDTAISGENESDMKNTIEKGINAYIQRYGTHKTSDAIFIKDLIAELALAMTDPYLPCFLKDGTPVTGVYIENGCIQIDTDNIRQNEIQSTCDNE